MKKLLKPLLAVLAAVMICSMMPSAFAAGDEAIDAAYALNELGLFNGVGKNADGTPNFDLDRAPTRHESVVMLVRLLGKEAEAKAGTWETPFTDVAEWAESYVGYAYGSGLVSGTSATKFSGTDVISVSQYLTLVLRALGYKSGADFQWDKAWELSDQIGLTDKRYNADSTQFTRGDIAIISRNALRTKEKEVEGTLLDALVASAAVDNETAEVYKSSVRVKSITLNESDLLMNRGGSVQLIASVLPEDVTDKSATWFSSDPKIVEVSSDGLLEAKQFGTVKITATASNGLSAVCNVTVEPIEVASITLNKTQVGLVIGETRTLNATIAPSNADNKDVVWSSSNTSVVTVAGGNITGIKEGSAIITATAGNQKAVCTISVTQAPLEFSGRGDKVITNITLPRGAYYVEYTHSGRSNFIVHLYYDSNGSGKDFLVNEIGNCSGQTVIESALEGVVQNGLLEVEADGAWKISIKKVSGKTSTNLKGSGNRVTGTFVATQKRWVYTCSDNGRSNFVVWIYSVDGDGDLVVNEIAPYAGSGVLTLDVGTEYFVSVKSEGDWLIDFGRGDSLEIVSADISSVGTSENESNNSFFDESDASDTLICYRKADYLPDFGAMFGIKPFNTNEEDSTIGFAYLASDVEKATGNAFGAYREYVDTLLADYDFEVVKTDSNSKSTMVYLRNKNNGNVCGIQNVIIQGVLFINIVATKS